MTNPDNIVRVRARNGGRASVYEANGWCQAYTSGLLEGNGVLQNTSADMNVLVGGSATKPDVVLAENAAGYKIALDLVGQQAVAITAPASNSRVSAIVAYTDDLSLATTEDTVTGSPASCGLIVVNGTAAASPSAPTDTQIRNAITSDGATGSQAAYCVIATITVASNTTIIDNSLIANQIAQINSKSVDFASLIPQTVGTEIDTGLKYGGRAVYAQRFAGDHATSANTTLTIDLIEGVDDIVENIGWVQPNTGLAKGKVGTALAGASGGSVTFSGGHYVFVNSAGEMKLRFVYLSAGQMYYDFTVFYTKA